MIDRNTDHEIETASTGSPVERADLRHRQADQALARAPEWVRRRIAEIRGERLDDGTVERRGGIETASEARELAAVTRSLAHAPAHIRRRVNEHRRRSGLPEVAVAAPEPRGSGVWVAGRGGTLRDAAVALRIGTIVVGVVADAGGVAAARSIGKDAPETITPSTFGTADELNRSTGLALHIGKHYGMMGAWAGRSMQFHTIDGALVFVWRIDSTNTLHRDAVAAVEAGRDGVSVSMRYRRCDARDHAGTTGIVRATLGHVALLTDGTAPAYPSCRAKAFHDIDTGDQAAVRKAITDTIRHGRFKAERANR
jgi:hypothetical protein